MQTVRNPFIVSGYVSADYFCDRKAETAELTGALVNGRNIVIVSPRRMGKTGLIEHCFHQKEIAQGYYTFFVDIYATGSLKELVFMLGKHIFDTLKPKEGNSSRDSLLRSVLCARLSNSTRYPGNRYSTSVSGRYASRRYRWRNFSRISKRRTNPVWWPLTSSSKSPVIRKKMWKPYCVRIYRNVPTRTSFLPEASAT